MSGKSLRLQALMNHFLSHHLAEESCTADATAVRLIALTAKSLTASSKFAPSNARDLVARRHRRLMDRLREAAAAMWEQDSAPSQLLQQAYRLKELTQELRACGSKHLQLVRSPHLAKQLCRLLRLGDEAYRNWEEESKHKACSSTCSSIRSSSPETGKRHPRGSCSPSPPKRSKRKTPERPTTRRSRLGAECCIEASPVGRSVTAAGVDASGSQPPRRLRNSSGEGDPPLLGLVPKQLFASSNCGSGSNSSSACSTIVAQASTALPLPVAGVALHSPADLLLNQQLPCTEWAHFKAYVASPRRGKSGSNTVAKAAATASAAQADTAAEAAVLQASPVAYSEQPSSPGSKRSSVVVNSSPGQDMQPAEVHDGNQAMDVDMAASFGSAEARLLTWRLTGRLPPAAGRSPASAAPGLPPSPQQLPIPAHLSPWQQGAASVPAASHHPLSPAHLAASGLRLPSPVSSAVTITSCRALISGTTNSNCSSRSSGASGCGRGMSGAVDASPSRAAASTMAAAGGEVVAADVMILLSDSSGSADRGDAGGSAMLCEPATEGTNPGPEQLEAASSVEEAVLADVAVLDDMASSTAHTAGASGHIHDSQRGSVLRQRFDKRLDTPGSKLVCHAGSYGVMLVDRRAVQQQAAQPSPPIGPGLDAAACFQALHGKGRAQSILHPLQLPKAAAVAGGPCRP